MSEPPPVNILIANEQAQEAKDVTLSLRAFFPHSRTEVAYSADEAVRWATKCEWQMILADVDLFRSSGLATLTELKRCAPKATLIIQADCNDMTLGMQVLRFGADFYVSKNSPAFLIELPFILQTLLKNQDLTSQLNATKGRLHAQEAELAQTREKKQLLFDQWEKIRQAHTKLEEELQQVTEGLAQERADNQVYREQLERLCQERDQLQERLFQVEGEKQSLMTQLGHTRQTSAKLEEGLQRHEARLSQLRIENQTYREQLETLRQERDQLKEQLEQLRQGPSPSREQIQRLEEQLSQVRQQHQSSSEQIEALRHERAQALDDLATIQDEKQYLLHQVENEVQEHAQALEQLAQLQGEKQSLVEQLQVMSRTHEQMEERIKRLEERLLREHRQQLP